MPTIEWERSSLSTATILKYVADALLDQQKDSFFIDLKKEALSRILVLKRTEENKLDRMGRAEIVWALRTILERNGNLFSVWPELTKYSGQSLLNTLIATSMLILRSSKSLRLASARSR